MKNATFRAFYMQMLGELMVVATVGFFLYEYGFHWGVIPLWVGYVLSRKVHWGLNKIRRHLRNNLNQMFADAGIKFLEVAYWEGKKFLATGINKEGNTVVIAVNADGSFPIRANRDRLQSIDIIDAAEGKFTS